MKGTEIYQALADNIQQVVQGKEEMVRLMLAAFFCGGHVLLEDVPGTGKTTLAKSLAKSVGTGFKRVQFTPDLLPSDLLGVSIFNQKEERFIFHQGPIFTNILLADEINRASPRTQSALLEAMAERQVSIEGREYTMDKPFLVIATENPIESHGTYPLPESQLDRFMVKLTLGYLDRDTEAAIIAGQMFSHPLSGIQSVIDEGQIFQVMEEVKQVRITEELRYYVVDLVSSTRQAEQVATGASVRASLALTRAAQALALFNGRDFVVPEDIIEAAPAVISHRLQLLPQAKFAGITEESVVKRLLKSLPVPK
ncbi:MAG: magnesium chelatase [Deltaproteobacteria bacterium]|nr:MAG: magnesium chelatase [Deltaproteobacteria bacterium]